MKRVAIYTRVSIDKQSTENQLKELNEVVSRNGWELVNVYEDKGISGAKGREDRPALNSLLVDAVRKKFDVVMAWSVDRLGRSLTDLLNTMETLRMKKIDMYLHQQGIDTTTPSGKAMFQMMGVFSEFERAMISERVKAGLRRTDKKGGRPTKSTELIADVQARRVEGQSIRGIASDLKVSSTTVQKYLKMH